RRAEAEIGRGFLESRRRGGGEVFGDQVAGVLAGAFVADFYGGEFGGFVFGVFRGGLVAEGVGAGEVDFYFGGDDFVEGGDGVAGADVAGGFGVVVEIFGFE